MRYDVFVTVWGQKFVEKYGDFSLASQLAPGNLPVLADVADVHYHIYTDRASRSFFDLYLEKLSAVVKVHFHFYDEIPYGGGLLEQAIENSDPATVKHNVQRITALHFLAELGQSAAILLDSDFIISDGSLSQMHEQRLQGKRAVLTSLMRLNEDSANPLLRNDLQNYLAPRTLVGLCLAHMHPIFERYFVDAEKPTSYPSQVNWRVGGSGLITHCFFPHPLMIIPDSPDDKSAQDRGRTYFSTMDYDYALRAVFDDESVYLSQSSDEILICKLSPESYLADSDVGTLPTVERMAHFILNNTNVRHSLFAEKSIRYVADDQGEWDQIGYEAERFFEAAYKGVEMTLGNISAGDAKTLVHLKSFMGPIEDFMSPQVQSRIKGWMPN